MHLRRRYDGALFLLAVLVAGFAVALSGVGASPAAAQDYSAWYGDDYSPVAERIESPRRRVIRRPKSVRPSVPRRIAKPVAAAPAAESRPAAAPLPKLPLFAVVSISDQHISIYNHDGLVVRSMVSTGVPGHLTPRGIFTIIGRERFHNSNIYSGAPMPFMQRITWSGIAMHLGVVPGRPASHGCIRLPASFAAQLWGMTKIGERVVISQQDVFPTEFSHRLLPTPKMRAAETSPASDKPPVAPGAQPATVEAPPSQVNPRQYAEQLKIKAVSDAAAAAKALKERMAELVALQQERGRADYELRAAEMSHRSAQARADAAGKAHETATAAAESAKQREVMVAAADIKTPDGVDADKAKPVGFSKAYERAVALRDAAAATKTAAAAALTEASAKLDAAKSSAAAKAAQVADMERRLGEAKAAADVASAARKEAERRMSPISVLVSKKDGKLYVRQGLAVLFDAPVTVRDPDAPIGTHLYIATAPATDGASLKWTALSPPSPPIPESAPRAKTKAGAPAPSDIPVIGRREPSGASEALERVEIAQDVRDRIAERLWTGGSIIISDQPPSFETGAEGTDLTVKLR